MRTEKNACRGICMRFSHHKARKSCMRQWAKIRENILFEEVRRCVLCDWLTQKSGGKKWTDTMGGQRPLKKECEPISAAAAAAQSRG